MAHMNATRLGIAGLMMVAASIVSGCIPAMRPIYSYRPLNDYQPPTPIEIQPPAPGEAAMYFLRPSFDKVAPHEMPTLSIDGHAAGRLAGSEYLRVALKPGVHTLAVTANAGESPNWNLEFQFTVEASSTYFTALWNQNQPRPGRPIAVPVVLPYIAFFVPVSRSAKDPERLVRVELLSREQAEPALAGLRDAGGGESSVPR